MKCDVAIIGGGPAGSTAAALLLKYNPSLRVVVVERERFPRDHVGESQLPVIANILNEMGVWDKVEAAEFPIKVGGTYRWGNTDDLWDLEFLPGDRFVSEARPAKFVGQRTRTAFQVDRSVYDKILLDHAAELGCEVYEGVKATEVLTEGDRVSGVRVAAVDAALPSGLSDGLIEARYYLDGSGDVGLLRRALKVEVDSPTQLHNLAIWDYWQDADWAVSIGVGGTRIQVLSLGWGWVWFIAISPTRTSVGLVVPAEHYKATGKSTEELYLQAIAEEPLVTHLLQNAKRENLLKATKDWSFIADRIVGENWFLIGDACGFADPILSAGMTLAHTSGRKVAYTILELERGELNAAWLKREYQTNHRGQIRHHIQFADYWYSANGRFTDLKQYCSEIAKSAGLSLDADEAFRWLGTGGFAFEEPGFARALTYRIGGIKFIVQWFSGKQGSWAISRFNVFKLNLVGAQKEQFGILSDGRIEAADSYRREERVLPITGAYRIVLSILQRESDAKAVVGLSMDKCLATRLYNNQHDAYAATLETLEALIAEGWIRPSVNKNRPFLEMETPEEAGAMHRNRDNVTI